MRKWNGSPHRAVFSRRAPGANETSPVWFGLKMRGSYSGYDAEVANERAEKATPGIGRNSRFPQNPAGGWATKCDPFRFVLGSKNHK
jgi:hypothetical protein